MIADKILIVLEIISDLVAYAKGRNDINLDILSFKLAALKQHEQDIADGKDS